ncbi:MAG: T9SS type A sorting domain-containing protein [bacterium]|nr:T9SS type A sorting domain-containing protein [bacterium]
MGSVVFIIIISMFSLRTLGSPYIYVDTNSYATLKIELLNDSIPRNLIFHFERISAPSDLQFMQCIQQMCYYSDSVEVSIPSGIRDTIQLDFYSGSETGPLNAVYRVYDADNFQDRDSVYITGQVPVREFTKRLYYKSGMLYGDGLKRVEVYDPQGVLLFSRDLDYVNSLPFELKNGVYFIRAFTSSEVQTLKILEVK